MPQVFHDAVITENGLNLLTKTKAGLAEIEFTRVVTGSGTYAEDETAMDNLMMQETLKDARQSFPISSVEVHSSQSVIIKILMHNSGLTDGYYINEMGLYAKEKGVAETAEVLYSVTVTKGEYGDYMPPYNGLNQAEIIQEYYATVYNASHVTVEAGQGAAALADDLNNHVQNEGLHLKPGEREKWNTEDIDCGYFSEVDEAVALAIHSREVAAHKNLVADGGNITVTNNTITLEEHLTDENAHQNIILDGNLD